MNQKVENLKGKLIVSCQALSNEPLHSSFIMGRMALAAKPGGREEALYHHHFRPHSPRAQPGHVLPLLSADLLRR